MMDLTSLETNNFLSAIDEHDLSVVVFYTKQAPIWPLTRTILKTTKANFTKRHPDYKIQWANVDLDKSPRLSTFSHLNMIDIMFFYPDLSLFPIRSRGNLSVSSLINETEYMWQYSEPGMTHWDDMSQLVGDFVLASFKGKGNPQTSVDAVEVHYRRTKAYVDLIEAAAKDQSVLASRTNKVKRKMLQFQSRLDDPDDFLEAKEELFMLESFLKHAFNKNQFLDKKKKKIAQSREKNRQPLLAEEPAPPADTGELM